MQTNQSAVQSFQATVDSTDTYYGDYLTTITEDGVVIMQELDELVLNMSIEE